MKDAGLHLHMLSIDLSLRGFGYALFDSQMTLFDWGACYVEGDKNDECIGRTKDLMDWYEPRLLVLENPYAPDSRRRPRIKGLSDQLVRLAEAMDTAVVRIPWSVVRHIWTGSSHANKDDVASRVAERFPEIRRHRPPKRKLWMREDDRMSIFDAVALGLTASRLKTSPDPL